LAATGVRAGIMARVHAVLEAARARTLFMAIARRWCCGDLAGSAWLIARRDRLAGAAKNLECEV
jgi:hypothetical protein